MAMMLGDQSRYGWFGYASRQGRCNVTQLRLGAERVVADIVFGSPEQHQTCAQRPEMLQ
jgi:hypothetical protein